MVKQEAKDQYDLTEILKEFRHLDTIVLDIYKTYLDF